MGPNLGGEVMFNSPDTFQTYSYFRSGKQFAEMSDDGKSFRTFFLQRDQLQNRTQIRGLSNWVEGTPPPNVQVAHPLFLSKVRSSGHFGVRL